MSRKPAVVLLVETDADLRDLNCLVLSEGGYKVDVLPPHVGLVDYVKKTRPDVIVIGMVTEKKPDWKPLELLQANAQTREIPVVVITTSESNAAEAQATPIVRNPIVAPYDIGALEKAVASALGHPPPAAVLPSARGIPSPFVAKVTDVLSQNAQGIILRTVRHIQRVEPYRSRFSELSRGLIDDLGILFGAIIDGYRRDLSPEEVFAVPTIRQAIDQHIQLRERQGVQIGSVIHEYQILEDELAQFLLEYANRQSDVSFRHVFEVSNGIQRYMNALIRIIAGAYRRPRSSGSAS